MLKNLFVPIGLWYHFVLFFTFTLYLVSISRHSIFIPFSNNDWDIIIYFHDNVLFSSLESNVTIEKSETRDYNTFPMIWLYRGFFPSLNIKTLLDCISVLISLVFFPSHAVTINIYVERHFLKSVYIFKYLFHSIVLFPFPDSNCVYIALSLPYTTFECSP